jgi:RHS repeat-associated protein
MQLRMPTFKLLSSFVIISLIVSPLSSAAAGPGAYASQPREAGNSINSASFIESETTAPTNNSSAGSPALGAMDGLTYTVYLPLVVWDDSVGDITPSGGQLTSPDAAVTFTFAPGAVKTPAKGRYATAQPRNLPPSLQLVGSKAFDFSVYSVANQSPIDLFPAQVMTRTFGAQQTAYVVTPTVMIKLNYPATAVAGLQEASLSLYRQAATGAWVAMPTVVNTQQHFVRATVERAGRYALLGLPTRSLRSSTAGLLSVTQVTTSTQKLVILNPDHGGSDPGGVVTSPANFAAQEKTYNLQVAKLVRNRLQACGLQVQLTREDDSSVSSTTRTDMINSHNPDVATTLAFNIVNFFMGNSSVTGSGPEEWNNPAKPGDYAFGADMNSQVSKFAGLPNTRGVKNAASNPGGPIYVALHVTPLFTHAELAFMDNFYDRAIMNDAKGMGAIADGVFTSILNQVGGASGVCQPGFELPEPLSAAERARLRNLGYQNWLHYGGDPVASTGNHIQQFTDFRVPGVGGFDFVLQRTYNTQDTRDGLFGFGWSSWLDMFLRLARDGSVDIRRPDGSGVYFVAEGDGYVPGQEGVFDTLTRNGPDFMLTTPDQARYQFKQFGFRALPMSVSDRHGNTITLQRDSAGKLTGLMDSAGRNFTFTYTGDRIASITDPSGRTLHYSYTNGDLTRVTDGNGGVRQFEYTDHQMTRLTDPAHILYLQNTHDAQGRILEQVDASGHHSTINYDTPDETRYTDNLSHRTIARYDNLSRVTELEDALGQKETFVYNDDYTLKAYTDKKGNTWAYTYDTQGNLKSATDPLSHVTQYGYSSTNDLTRLTDLGGPGNTLRTTNFIYDAEGNLTRIERADGTTIQATYDSHGQRLTLTDGNGHTARYTYDSQGNLTDVTSPAGNTHYSYDALGRQTSMTDANGHTVQFSYDGNDNILQLTDPKGQVTRFTYDGNDDLIQLTDRRGGVTTYTYDENLKLTAETDPMGHTTAYSYDAMYNRVSLTDSLGHTTHYRYDNIYQLKEVEDALHGITRFDYDPNGNLVQVTDALNHLTQFEYDPLNRLTRQIDALNGATTFGYDAVGRLTTTTNPNSATTRYTYDLLDQPTLARDALDGDWQIGYDNAGNIIRLIDANGHTTRLTYDAADRLITHQDPGGHVTRFAHDGVGNTITVTDALGGVTRSTYDANDNLATITDALNGVTMLTYNQEDQLIAFQDANGHTTHFDYDLDGLLTTLTEAGGQITAYRYDAVHNLTRRVNAKGNAWNYAYDELNRRVTETDPLNHTTTYGYDALSRRIRVRDANGVKTRYDYDPLARLIAVVQNEQPGQPSDHQTNVTTNYTYDPVGNLNAITDANGEMTGFVYDLLNQLKQETNPLKRLWSYEYDKVGNLTTRTDAKGQITHYSYDSDDLLTAILYPDSTSVSFGYDAVHNQTRMTDSLGVTRNVYDALNRLIASTNHLNQTVSYAYDTVGNRTSLTYPDGKIMNFAYDETNFAVRVLDPDGNPFVATRDATHNIARIDYPNLTHVEYDIDAAERLTAVRNEQNDGAMISSFAYLLDPVGNRMHVDGYYTWRQPTYSNQLNLDYQYDPLYRLTRSDDSDGHFTTYAYDAVGNRTRRTTNDDPTLKRELKVDSVTTTYTYDAANELIASIRDVAPRGNPDRALQTAQILRAFVQETEAQSGKHVQADTATNLKDQANTLISNLEGNSPPASDDAATQLASLQTAVQTAGTDGTIDNSGIVTSLLAKLDHAGNANAEIGDEAHTTLYNYDLNGNRIRRTQPDETTATEKDWFKSEYTYDFENRLVHEQDFRTPGTPGNGDWLPGDETMLQFDGYGRVFRRQHDQHIGGGGDQMWVDYVYDGLDPIAEYEHPDTQQYVNYYRGLDRILNMRQNAGGGSGDGTVYYFHHDGLGSVSALSKQLGQSDHTYRYHDYGIPLDVNGHAADSSNFTDPHNHYSYTGQEWDEHLNLFHFYAREYDPETGTWLQQDWYRGQLYDPMSLHRYGYVENRPTVLTDPYGYCPPCILGVAIVGGAIVGVGARYVGDVVKNAMDGKQGWDILKPSSSGKQYLVSAGTGALGGGLSLINPFLGVGVSTALESTLEDVVEGKPINPGKVVFDTAISLVTVGIGNKIAKTIFPTQVRGRIATSALRYLTSQRMIRQISNLGIDTFATFTSKAIQGVFQGLSNSQSRSFNFTDRPMCRTSRPILACYNNQPPACHYQAPVCRPDGYLYNNSSSEVMGQQKNYIRNLINNYLRKGKELPAWLIH